MQTNLVTEYLKCVQKINDRMKSKPKIKREKKVKSIAYTRLNIRNSIQRQQIAIIYETATLLSYHRMQHKVVKHLTQLIHAILLEAHKTL